MASINPNLIPLNYQQHSPFFDLPGELRNAIYEYLPFSNIVFIDLDPTYHFHGLPPDHSSAFSFRCANPDDEEMRGQGPLPPDSLLKPASAIVDYRKACRRMRNESNFFSSRKINFEGSIFSFKSSAIMDYVTQTGSRWGGDRREFQRISDIYIPDLEAYYLANFVPGTTWFNQHGNCHEFRVFLPGLQRIFIAPNFYVLHDINDNDPEYFMNWDAPPYSEGACRGFFNFSRLLNDNGESLAIHFHDPFASRRWAHSEPDLVSVTNGVWTMTDSWIQRKEVLKLFTELPFAWSEIAWAPRRSRKAQAPNMWNTYCSWPRYLFEQA